MATLPDLKTRDLEILQLVLAGSASKGIAAEIYISEKTVEFCLNNINLNVGVRARILAAMSALNQAQASYLLE